MHKISLLEDAKRKFLRPKFWSLGTPLGYMGPVSQRAIEIGFCQLQFLVIQVPYDYPVLVAPQGQAKNPKPTRSQCDSVNFKVKKGMSQLYVLLVN